MSPPWLPGFVLRARIRHHLNNIKKEDAALKREGVCKLNEIDLKKVCYMYCLCDIVFLCNRSVQKKNSKY